MKYLVNFFKDRAEVEAFFKGVPFCLEKLNTGEGVLYYETVEPFSVNGELVFFELQFEIRDDIDIEGWASFEALSCVSFLRLIKVVTIDSLENSVTVYNNSLDK